MEDLTLIDEQRLALEARISQVSEVVENIFTGSFFFSKFFSSYLHCASQLDEEIAVQNESREREMPLVQEIDSNVKELRQTISGLNNHQMSLKASIRKLKERAKEMDEKVSCVAFCSL